MANESFCYFKMGRSGISNPFYHHPNIIPNKLGGFLKHKKCCSFAWQMKTFVFSTWGAPGYPIPSIQNPIIIPQARLRVWG